MDDAVGTLDISATVGSFEDASPVVGEVVSEVSIEDAFAVGSFEPVTDGAGAVGSIEPGEDTGAEVSIAGGFVLIIGGTVSPGQKIVSGGID